MVHFGRKYRMSVH